MSSYLTYCLACVNDLTSIPQELWSEDITIYQYCPLLRKDRVLKYFRRVHHVFLGNVHLSLVKEPMQRVSPEAQRLIWNYGIFYIQFPRFTYLRVGGFKEEPIKLPRYALDYFMIAEICRKIFSVIQDNLPEEKWESIFPIKLGSLAYTTMINALEIECDLLKFNLGFYKGRRDFDNKRFLMLVPSIKDKFQLVPHLEDLWEDCDSECEVMKRYQSMLIFFQITMLKLKFKQEGMTKDSLEVVE